MDSEQNKSARAAPQPTMAAEAIFAAPPSSRRVCNVAVMATAGMFVGSAFPLFAAIDAGLRWVGQKAPYGIALELTPLCASVLLFLIMGGVFLACIHLARLCSYRIGVAEFGITCLRPRRQPATLRWEEVSGVRQGWFPHRLILLDDDSKQRMVVPYSLVEDADELLGWVYGHWYLPRRGDGGPLSLPRTFHKSIAALLTFLAYFLLSLVAGTVFALVGGEYEVAILLGGLALVVSFLIAFAPGANVLGHLTVKEGEIVRHRWGLLPRRCSVGDIQGVGFSARGITLARRGRRRPLLLGHFKESPFEVYDVLLSAWEAWRAR